MSDAAHMNRIKTGAHKLWNNLYRTIYDQVAPELIKDVADDIYYNAGLSEVVDDIIDTLT